jgi:hypothetical protein
LREIVRFTSEQLLEHLAMLLANGNIWHLPPLYRRLGAAALEFGLITPEGEVTAEGYAVAALYEEPTKDQRLLTEVADEPVPGPFAVPNVNA